ncbi:ubiquitin carboxyl-terminal hydrolase 25-like isoform X2 [Scleropages formosus]|uniref:ubiquitin carboxyl-terminal hydrolase 25-like isoform X2 n=1 Tax=Scleropages formosus TaxID=113540 RepID=UPI00087838C8|nr:ubiquitin carboxyl-terminal hydrolase 25-like isoform X2 [Scleropages formosus]
MFSTPRLLVLHTPQSPLLHFVSFRFTRCVCVNFAVRSVCSHTAMTVEQNVLQQHCEKHQQTLLNQLREITGSTDVRILQQALQVSNGDLGEAVAFLTDRSSEAPQQNEATYYQTAQTGNDRHVNVGSQARANVIDLTGDDKEDLQRAIALSLEESSRTFQETGITDEEQAISRVLEASIAENKGSLTSTHMEVWSDPPNPHDRKRQENCPVGLKNVGNTCWFSAVIQSLFHLLEFQRLVLQYSPPANTQDLLCNQKEPRNLPFMQELRCLFSLMVGSKRRYVDPSRAVEILKGAFKSTDSQQVYVFQQQDVSEFSHKLLDWLEDAFQMKAEEEREGEQPKNPMVELFYGHFVAVGVLEGKKFENTETFGQYPLQVNGYKDLHESLEAAMIEGDIESLHSEKPGVSGQEHWFAELPPVLTFELSRFQFNQVLGRPEKIHNKLEFPAVLYLDRYLNRNRDITRVKRREMRRLKEHLLLLQQRLERYMSYGSGPKRCPLADVLEYTVEFASSQPILSSPSRAVDATGTQPGGTAAPPQPALSMTDQGSPNSTEGPLSAPFPQQRVPVHKPLTQSRVLPNPLGQPAPRFITEEELRVLEGCLQRWRSEVEKDTRELQGYISRIHTTMELMYSDTTLMQVPYRLHAVLVHEGQASAGHYWAYIFSPQLQHWLKFNDVSVTKSTWEELVRDSFGGYRNASAYCLMYVDDKKPFLVQEKFDKETGQMLSGLDKLPADLKEYVKEDNRLFEKELREWDMLQAHRAAVEKLASAMAGTSTESEAAQPDGQEPSPPESGACRQESEYMEQGSHAGNQEHWREDTERAVSQAAAQQEQHGPEGLLNAAMLTPSMQSVIRAIGRAWSVYDKCGPEAAFFKAIKLEYGRLLWLAQQDTSPENDPRLLYVMVYLIKNQAPKTILERTLLTQFADRDLSFNEQCKNIMKVAQEKLHSIRPEEVNIEEYETWHRDYHNFRETTVFLMIGLELFQKESYVEALMYLIYSYQYNKKLLSRGPYRGHDKELIAHYRRECLLRLNEHAAALFQSGEEPELSDGMTIMNELVVPCLPLLLANEEQAEERDMAAVEDIRNRWCSYLGQEMEPKLQETLTDFLPKLLDCSVETRSFRDPPRLPSLSTLELRERFSRVLTSLRQTSAKER